MLLLKCALHTSVGVWELRAFRVLIEGPTSPSSARGEKDQGSREIQHFSMQLEETGSIGPSSIRAAISPPIHTSIHTSFQLLIYHPSVYHRIHLSTQPATHPPDYLSSYLSTCPSF